MFAERTGEHDIACRGSDFSGDWLGSTSLNVYAAAMSATKATPGSFMSVQINGFDATSADCCDKLMSYVLACHTTV